MAKLVGTVARVNAKTGIWEHKHEGAGGWHWASAGHRDAGELHASVKAAEPTFMEGTKGSKEDYLVKLNRTPGHVSQIPGKANDGKGVYVKAK